MHARALISECGLFIAVPSGHELHVHSLQSPDSPLHYDLSKIFFRHRKLPRWALYKPRISISIIQWEHVASAPSTKVAVCASDDALHLVLIFSLAEPWPAIIEADAFGVERLQWLPLLLRETSAYKNSTLLAVFTKHGLELRLYSLMHTHVLVTVPKPVIGEVFVRPDSTGVWSVVSSAYYEKNSRQKAIRDDPSALWPTLLHFHTDGVLCSLLASLKLDFDPSPAAAFSWSMSGKWLLYFDTAHSLDAHKLLVFNALGVHDKAIEDITCHVLQTTRTLSYEPESTESRMAGLFPQALWGRVKHIDYIVVVPTHTILTLRLRVSDVLNMFKSQIHELDLRSGIIWTRAQSGPKMQYKRDSTLPTSLPHNWSKIRTFGSSHLIATDNCVVLFRPLFDKVLRFDIVATIVVNLALLEAKELHNGSHLLVFNDHVALRTPAGMESLSSSTTEFTEVKVNEENEGLTISLVETGANNSAWRQLKYKFSSNRNSAQETDSSEIAMKEVGLNTGPPFFNATKDAGSILHRFVKDLQPGQFSDSSGPAEEITDTFQTQKRRRL
ncbi:hypothetical protein METBIDRAFT_46214 [Metschnikowia bicuspidata var. bicuspidata NRRL YB-4993]|uniref:Uncharacterized protein n=1 Tax=Metschnikowia bicuspidata var. bicuspidata NRRL YB-4993 TaxID=869754 RepID=A0A1A0H704_9ASCO|nr:hypothetical protein METBIDRAFT_46214 [Metschnikowia bicuspidata var. bicuspidata NRRL YB-4993]OBA19687.1 hypothetical protein METBIDRAFT_46214 [Metschnikowia bicuspidata var. bicuspidata NRRL YB-4993]